MIKKYILLIIISSQIFGGSGTDSDTTRVLDLRQFSTGGDIDTLRDLSSGSSGNTLGDNKIKNLKIGDYLQIDNRDEFVIKTVSRHLIVDDFKMINMYKTLKSNIEEKKDELEVYLGEVTSEEVIQELEISIIPFGTEDF